MKTDLTYFSQHGVITNPGHYDSSLSGLPADIAGLVKVVQGLMVHVFWASRYGLSLSEERKSEVQLRTTARRLENILALDPRPLTEQRDLGRKSVGNCRDFSVLLVSMLRHQGVPARARCGFATYFIQNHFEDHWVCEYWNDVQQRWVLVDAQLDTFQCEALGISINPLDVPRDQFTVGGKAWQMCRDGQSDPEQFGIFDMHGLGFVRGNVVRDVASLNKTELLPWDCWGVILSPLMDDPADLALLDQVARLTCGNIPDHDTVQKIYESDPRLKVEDEIQSYVDGGMQTIKL